MKKPIQAILLLLSGTMLLRLTITGVFNYYVVEGMRYLLVPSGVFLLGLGLWYVWDLIGDYERRSSEERPDDDADSHDVHHHVPVIAYALLLPIAAVTFISPTPLGSFSAARESAVAPAPKENELSPVSSDRSSGSLSLREFVTDAVWYEGKGLQKGTVELTGFVTPDPAGGWWLARLSMSCCAGDARAARIKVLDAPDLPADTWVTVEGRWTPGGGTRDASAIPLIQAESVSQIPVPANPYE